MSVVGFAPGPAPVESPAVELGMLRTSRRNRLDASYDAARASTEFDNYWANADAYDADSANSIGVRQKLVQRSRYEVENNGYAAGIARTYSTDLIGTGPSLRMQTNSLGFNVMVELAWHDWTKAIGLRAKLWTMAHAKHVDGETFCLVRKNPRVRNTVKLDLVIRETEQCQTPFLPFNTPGQIDGVTFDEFGNPVSYDFLKYHPGAANAWAPLQTETVPARYCMHWFKVRRPGQHRGIPELTSTLNVGASSRRFREATVAAAETAADFAVLLKTQQAPEAAANLVPFTETDIRKRMMATLPAGWDPMQMKAEHPNSTYNEFIRQQIGESARPISMPLCKAACDSSNYNYASGRLDYQSYYAALDIDRQEVSESILDRMFDLWFEMAVLVYGWLGGDPSALSEAASYHEWDWPKHQVADIEAEAKVEDMRLRNGSLSPSEADALAGKDSEDRLVKMAADHGVSVDEMRTMRRIALFNNQNQQASMESAAAQTKQADSAANPQGGTSAA